MADVVASPRLSLLLVDDHRAILEMYRNGLEHRGSFAITLETDPQRALALASKQLFDCLVIDARFYYRGLELGGLRLAEELAPRYGSDAIVVVSRYVTYELIRERNFGHRFLEKHDSLDMFVAALAECAVELRARQYAFVAMPFSDALQRVYDEGIKPAIESVGFRCLRIDEVAHTKGIQDVILEGVQKSKFVVFLADEKNPNAYYEAGFADAFNKEVIILAKSFDDLCFDIANRNAIAYRGRISKLRSSLAAKIRDLCTAPPFVV